jgi:hypothetical protein
LTRRAGLLLVLAASGLFFYLWPALSAPVVLWSDSALDLEWARQGVGIVSPVPPASAGAEQPAHPAKPAYLLFISAVLAIAPSGHEERTIVVVQSLFLWLSIAATSLFVGRRRGTGFGVAVYLILVLFLRLRDSASAVMPEALAAALLLPIAARLLDPPRTRRAQLALGLATALLFWVRPNVGGIALLLAIVAFAASRDRRAALPLLGGFALLFAPVWVATKPAGGERLRGLGFSILEASQDYYWHPAHDGSVRRGPAAEIESRERSQALANWKAALSRRGVDARRELAWRAFHGLLGTELYDTSWSRSYQRLDTASRIATPFFLFAAAALLLTTPLRGPGRAAGCVGVLLLVLLVAQNLLLGSNPRFVLPFLPVLLLLAAHSSVSLARGPRRLIAVAVFLLFLGTTAANASVLDWQWGRIESAGVRIRQWIPKGSLPREAAATLHIRIASPVVPSAAHFMVLGPDRTVLYTSENDADRREPAITAALPQSLLDANAAEPVEIEVVTFGSYGDFQYLLFPVIPPPWRASALRVGSDALSPSTGIRSGALDWWAHAGAP